MHNCGMAHRMTIFQIMNTSNADGKHFNLSKNDCTDCCQNGSAAVITLAFYTVMSKGKKKQNVVHESHKWPEMTLIKISAPMKHLTVTQSHKDDVYSSMTRQKLQRCAVTRTAANLHVLSPEAPGFVLFHLNSTSGYRGSSLR